MTNKMYIIGPVGSGKSTLARQLSALLGTPCWELDLVVHRPLGEKRGNAKRTPEKRDNLFRDILAKDRWIVEDCGRACFEDALRQADQIVWLDPPRYLRRFRIVRRWLLQNLGMERCEYVPGIKMLRNMMNWSRGYDTGADGLRARLAQYADKTVVLRTKGDTARFLSDKYQKRM